MLRANHKEDAMNTIMQYLEKVYAAVAFAEHGLWDEAQGIMNSTSQRPERPGKRTSTVRQRPRLRV